MPHYYLHQVTQKGRINDPEGADYDDLDAAVAEAVLGAREIMGGRLREGREPDGSSFEIADEDGQVLRNLEFAQAADGHSFDEKGRRRAP